MFQDDRLYDFHLTLHRLKIVCVQSESEVARRGFRTPTRVNIEVRLAPSVKAIDKTFSNELVYDAIVCDGFD
jgi:hypothetical protein